MKAELIIFDCDGVLVDSEILGIELTLGILRRNGCPISREDFSASYSGLAWNNLIKKINADFHLSVPVDANHGFFNSLYDSFRQKLVRVEGTREVISNLDKPICVCSNSSAEQVRFMLELTGLDDLFKKRVFSAADLGESRCKPKPDIFLYAAEHFRVQPCKTAVIEDSFPGVTAAKAAGMYTIGFIGGAHTYQQHADRLLEAGADIIIKTMAELPGLIE